MAKVVRTLCWAVFLLGFISLASSEAQAQKIKVNDGKIEYIKYSPDAIVIKLTRKGINRASAFLNARDIAKKVESLRPRAYRAWPKIRINKLAWIIQYHANAYSLGILRSHANPVNVYWWEVT